MTRPAKRTKINPAAPVESENMEKKPNAGTNSAVNIEGSGFLDEVIQRDYAENGSQGAIPDESLIATQQAEPIESIQVEPPTRSFLGQKKAVIVDVNPVTPLQGPSPGSRIDEMQYQTPIIDTSADAATINQQMGEKIGMTTSELAFGYLEKLYPELVQYFIKIDQGFVTEADLPTDLELRIVKRIIEQNQRNKDKVTISEFHRKNILPPLQSILAKKGWEDVIPDEVQLVIALCVLAADTFWKVREIRQEIGIFKQEVGLEIHRYTEAVEQAESRQDVVEKELAELKAMITANATKKGGA